MHWFQSVFFFFLSLLDLFNLTACLIFALRYAQQIKEIKKCMQKYGAMHMYQVCYLLIDSNFHMIAYFFFFFFFTLAEWIVYANYM